MTFVLPNRLSLLFGLILVSIVGGCGAVDKLSNLGLGRGEKPEETVAVAGRSVVIGGPQGYCIDKGASRISGESPFVLLGSCASIAGDRNAGAPGRLGVLTAVVSSPGGPSFAETLPAIEAFFASPQGRAALARDGDAASVTLLGLERVEDILIVHLADTSAAVAPGIAPEYWRALFEVNQRLVTVSVMSFEENPLPPEISIKTLRGFVSRIQRESAAL